MNQPTFFDDQRSTLRDALDMTAHSLNTYIERYAHVAVAFSGGKDSTAALTTLCHLLDTGRVAPPKTLTILYADTRLEIPPLHQAALQTLAQMRERGYRTHIVNPPMDRRFYVMMLGRGIPPPHNGFRWCTGVLKVDPMALVLETLKATYNEKLLLLTGMRLGESAQRDGRITLACSRHDGECGAGWFQQTTDADVADTLAPLLHWRVCHIADWLMFDAPSHGFQTDIVAEIYGAGAGNTEPLTARTGCMMCPVAGKDTVMERLTRKPQWAYLRPLLRLRQLYEELSLPKHRIRHNGERRKNGDLSKRPNRLGPLRLKSRWYALNVILDLQYEVNTLADAQNRPPISLINADEHWRIAELIQAQTWPDGWTGNEPNADDLLAVTYPNGAIQPLLATTLEGSDYAHH